MDICSDSDAIEAKPDTREACATELLLDSPAGWAKTRGIEDDMLALTSLVMGWSPTTSITSIEFDHAIKAVSFSVR